MREGMSLRGRRPAEFQVIDNRDDATLEAFDRLADELTDRFERAFAGPGDWHERFACAVDDSLGWLLANPGSARLWFFEARRTSDPELQAHRAAARGRLIEIATDPRMDVEDGIPGLHVEFLFGALSHAAYDELARGGDGAAAVRKLREMLVLFQPLAA